MKTRNDPTVDSCKYYSIIHYLLKLFHTACCLFGLGYLLEHEYVVIDKLLADPGLSFVVSNLKKTR